MSDTAAPSAALISNPGVLATGISVCGFTIRFEDPSKVKVSTIDASAVQVTGPNGYQQMAQVDDIAPPSNAVSVDANFLINSPAGAGEDWVAADDGEYTIRTVSFRPQDMLGNCNTVSVVGELYIAIGPPWLLSVAIGTDGVSVLWTFVKPVTGSVLPVLRRGGTVLVAGNTVIHGDGTVSQTLTAVDEVFTGEIIIADYASGDVQDLTSQPLAVFTSFIVTNASEQAAAALVIPIVATGRYITIDDLAAKHGLANLKQWADKDNLANATTISAAIQAEIDAAEAEIDDYFRNSIFNVPLSTVDVIIKGWAVDLASAKIYHQRGQSDEGGDPIAGHLTAAMEAAWASMRLYRSGVVLGQWSRKRAQSTAPTSGV